MIKAKQSNQKVIVWYKQTSEYCLENQQTVQNTVSMQDCLPLALVGSGRASQIVQWVEAPTAPKSDFDP